MINNPSTKEINEAKNLNPKKYVDFTLVELIQYCIAINNFNIIFSSPEIIKSKVKRLNYYIPVFNRGNLVGYDYRIIQ